MINVDKLYKEAQAQLNKEQMGYLPPAHFILFANSAVQRIQLWLIHAVKQKIHRENLGFDSQGMAHLAEYYEQLLEYYLAPYEIDADHTGQRTEDTSISLPSDFRFAVEFHRKSDGVPISKLPYGKFNLAKRNHYQPANSCAPKYTIVGNKIEVYPEEFGAEDRDKGVFMYIREAVDCVWAYQVVNDKPMYDSTLSKNVDLPGALYDEILTIVLEKAGLSIRDTMVVGAANTDQQQAEQKKNRD